MEITKPNDLLVASINNPEATTYDLMTLDLNPTNTSLYKKEDYEQTKFVQDRFKDDKGQFDQPAFDSFYAKVANHYKEMTDDNFVKGLDTIQYSPFDITRPKNAETYKVSVEFAKDYNPFKQTYSRTGINSVDESNLSLRELAQQSKVFDPENNTWSEKSANDMGLLDKFFGDTLVYAQWDADGMHKDIETGRMVNHKKSDWKVNDDGNLFLEKLGKREIYGKQVVNPQDMLTTDGSFANNFDIFDADSKEKSVLKTSAKIAFDIAPFLIPGVAEVYGGIKAAVGLASVLPTFYKSFEGMLLGDAKTSSMDMATAAESYLAKFNQNSISDAAQGSLFNYEQMSGMISSVFSQIYEQRAMASLSMIIKKPAVDKWEGKAAEIAKQLQEKLGQELSTGKIGIDNFMDAFEIAKKKIPELASVIEQQGKLSKALALGYMAITSTSDIYGQAIQGGYDRRTAGFAALASAAGQYGIMMNNRMGDWFLDKGTGYNLETNKALIRKSVMPIMEEVQAATREAERDLIKGKISLAGVYAKIKNNFEENFLSPSVVGEAMWKNAYVEGVEEVTEQLVQDATKGIVDTMSFLGLTKKKGTFGGTDVVFSKAGWENYLANFVGGVLGGAMFEFNRIKIEPFITGRLMEENTKTALYDNIANGHKDQLIEAIRKQKGKFGNKYISLLKEDGTFDTAEESKLSQADVIADKSIEIINVLDGILNSQNLGHSDADIVSKAIRDSIIIKDLTEKRGQNAEGKDNKLGIEGLILTDFKNKRNQILKLTDDINTLEQDPENNKEAIAELQAQRSVYAKQANDILDGEVAEKYYNQINFYLNKEISQNWVIVDKDTFSKHKYGRNYKDLTEKGLGISKERIDAEYKEYIDGKDVEKELEMATNAYLDFEAKFNPAIAAFIDSGYSDEITRTFKNLFNNPLTRSLFSTEGEEGANNISNYLEIAQSVEKLEGNTRVLPWEAIHSTIAEKIKNSSGFSVEDGDRMITLENGQEIKVKDAAENILHNSMALLPPEKFDYNMLSDIFRQGIDNTNKKIRESRPEIFQSLELAYADAKTPEEKEAIGQEIAKHLVTANLDKFETTPEFLQNFELIRSGIQQKYVGAALTNENIEEFIKLAKVVKLEQLPDLIPFNELLFLLDSYAKVLGIAEVAPQYFEDFKKNVEALKEISDEEKATLIEQGVYVGKSRKAKAVRKAFLSSIQDLKTQTNAAALQYNARVDIYKQYEKEIVAAKKDMISNAPSLFKVSDVLMIRLIEEIKTNKSLDGEVLRVAKEVVRKYLEPIVKIAKEFPFTEQDIVELASMDNKDLGGFDVLLKNITESLKYSDSSSEEVMDKIFELADFLEANKNFPKRISDIKGTITNIIEGVKDEIDKTTEVKNLIEDLNKTLEEVLRSKPTLEKVAELYGSTSDTKKFISNPLYDLLRQISLSLDSGNKTNKSSILDILEAEQGKLNTASDLTTYFANGTNPKDLEQAINTVKLAQSVIQAMSTTQLSFGDPYGFIASRQNFIKNNGLTSDSSNLKVITSDMAQLMAEDLQRISIKLQFLKDLAKYNSGLISREQKIIRTKVNALLISKWSKLSKKDIIFKEKPLIPGLEEIMSKESTEQEKLFAIENTFYESVKDYSQEDKIAIAKLLANEFPFTNTLESLYSKTGNDEITKDIKDIGNNDMLLYLMSNMVMSSKDFNIKLLHAFKNGFDKAPFFTQEMGLKIMYASLINKDLFSEVIKSLSPINETTEDKQKVQTHDTSLITYILGNAGTGKTTVMIKLLLSMLLESNPALDVWFSGPELEQAQKLHKDATSGLEQERIPHENLSKLSLLERLGIKEIVESIEKDKKLTQSHPGETVTLNNESTLLFKEEPVITLKTDLPDIIFIDEASHYKAYELELIHKVVKLAGDSGKIIKVFAAGDPYQEGVDFGDEVNSFNYNLGRVSGIFIPQLFLTIRAQNNQKRDNNEVLVNTVRRISRMWETANTSTNTVFNTILQDGISLKHFKDKDSFNGDFLVNKIPDDVLNIIAKNIAKDSKKTVGILTSDGNISDDLKNKLNRAGIPLATETTGGYIAVQASKVQGREFDYFIFNTSQTKRKSIFDTLKALYTYSSRARSGTIIVNDAPIEFGGRGLQLTQIEDSYTEELVPLSPEEIARLKEERQGELVALVGADSTLSGQDFSFTNNNKVESDSAVEGEVAKEGAMIDMIVHNSATEIQRIKFSISKTEKKNPGSVSALVHTFYHDLGVNEKDLGNDNVRLTLNPNANYNYIITALFEGKGSKEMKWSEYNTLKNTIITEKFDALKNKTISSNFVKTIFGTSVVVDDVEKSFAVIADTYHNDYNNPKDLTHDTEAEHLKDGDKYLNLVMKLTYNGKDFILHLGTFPKLTTIEKYYDKNHSVFTSFKTLLDEAVVGKYSIIESNRFNIVTSTRLYSGTTGGPKVNVRARMSLQDLVEKPGIKFYDAAFQAVTEPVISFFPKNIEDYKRLFDRTTFGEPMTNQQLEESFKARRAKPYIRVSFINDEKHIQFITLHSEKRSWKEITGIIYGDKATGKTSLSEKIKAAEKNEEKRKDLNAISSGLFSADDVVDLWISLAKTNPKLYADFLENGQSWLDEIIKPQTSGKVNFKVSKEAVEALFGKLNKDLSKNILDLITYGKAGSAEVYQKIMDIVKANPKITNAEVKAKLLETVLRKPTTKFWAARFWNIFKLAEQLKNNKGSLSATLDEKFSTIMENIIEVWQKSKPEGLYYNVPIWSDKQVNLVNMSDKQALMSNLYTGLEPEGPHLLLDLHGIGSIKIDPTTSKESFLNTIEDRDLLVKIIKELKIPGYTKNWTTTAIRTAIAKQSTLSLDKLKTTIESIAAGEDQTKQEELMLKEKVKELHEITYNRKAIIKAVSTDTLNDITNKIVKALSIKDILNDAKNTNKVEELTSLSLNQLTNILNNLTGDKGSIQLMMADLADIKKGKQDKKVGTITSILERILNNNPDLAGSLYENLVSLYGNESFAKLKAMLEEAEDFTDVISALSADELVTDDEWDILQREGCE